MDVNNSVFSAMAATACRVLAEYGGRLPEVASVAIGCSIQGTHEARFRPVISFQCRGSVSSPTAVAQWADEFGSAVRLLRRADCGFVEVSTQTVIDGHEVLVWDHLTPTEADTLAAALGERLDVVLDIDPDALRAQV
jgi:hypothetical protein